MDNQTVYEVICKLVGPIDPVGETHTDNKRLENLKTMTRVLDHLLDDVLWVSAHHADSKLCSMKESGQLAQKFLLMLKDYVQEVERSESLGGGE